MPFPAGSEPRRSTRLGPSQPVRPHPPASGSARSSLLRNCAYQPVAGRDTHHLPAQLTSFVGREQELAMLGKLLGEARLVTLTGVGATRKTRLTVEFADGVWLADLAGLSDPNLVGAAPGARTQNPRIKRGPLGRQDRSTCADATRGRTESTHCTGIRSVLVSRVVPRYPKTGPEDPSQ